MNRIAFAVFAFSFAAAGSAAAQEAQLNHLDCRFNEATSQIDCPPILDGRAATAAPIAPVAVPAPAPSAGGKPAKGSTEWNSYCAAKYKSFDPATGNYRGFSGQTKPCL